MKLRTAAVLMLAAIGLFTPEAHSAGTVHASIYDDNICASVGTEKVGNATITRNGRHVRVKVDGALPAGDYYEFFPVKASGCDIIGTGSGLFFSNGAGYFEATASFTVPTSIHRFIIEVLVEGTTADLTPPVRVLP